MIYAIKITEEHKQQNAELLKEYNVGDIAKFSQLPKKWNRVVGYRNSASAEQILNDGFKEVVEPTLTIHQKIGNIIEDTENNNFTYEKIDFTVEEVELYTERLLDQDVSAQKESKFKNDGEQAYMKLKQYIRRQLAKENITLDQFNNIYTPIREKLYWLNFGDWDIAKIEIDSITPPKNVNLLNILNTIKNKINNYIIENY